MFGRTARFDAHTSVVRVAGVVAILLGILLLQGSLCDGSLTSGVPCIASCDEPLLTPAADNHATVDTLVDIDAPAPPDDQGGLVSLCVTVLLAVLAAFTVVRRPGLSLAIPQVPSAPPVARNHTPALPALCALRL